MSLVDVFGSSEIRGIKLRMIVEKIGKKILLLSAIACCELTMKEIAQDCSRRKLMRKNPNASNPVSKSKKPQLPFIAVSIYDGEVEKVNKELKKNNPNWTSFDITFLNKILSLIEADFPKFFTNEVRDIKNERNAKMHNEAFVSNEEFDKEFEKLLDLFMRSLEEAEKIGISLLSNSHLKQNKIDEISSSLLEIESLRNNIFNEMNKIKFDKIDESLSNAEEYLEVLGHEEINASFSNLVFMNPVFFLMGKKFALHVERFYTQPEFTMKDSESCVSLNCILDMIENDGSNFLIEAQAGLGKTTFMRLLMAKKISGERFENILLIPYECRKKNLSSLSDVIADTLPKASHKFSEDNLVKALLSFKPVFLLDGLDERNETSDEVLKEIISLVVKKHARFIATSRPEGVENILREIDKDYEYIEINGIAKENLNDIVMLYYDMFSENINLNDLPEKKQVMNTVLKMWGHFKDQIRSPLILCLITYLLVNKDESFMQSESITSIYISIFDALFKKLKTRLIDRDGTSFNQRRFRMDVKKFEDKLCSFSLDALKKDKFFLSFEESCELVDDFSQTFGDEALSSMFVGKGHVSRTGIEISSYAYPHKSFQEFLSAKEVSKMIAYKKINKLDEILGKKDLKNISLISFIVGLLVQDCKLDVELCKEIASILQLKYIHTPFHKDKLARVLLEANEDRQMVDSLASNFLEIYIDADLDDFDLFNSVLRSSCSSLKYIEMDIAFKNEIILTTMALLREKSVKVFLRFPYDKNSKEIEGEDIIKRILGGRCVLDTIEGRLSSKCLRLLPKEIRNINLVVETEDEAAGLRWLSEESHLFHDQDHSRQHGKVNSLELKVFSGCDVDLLPVCLPLPQSSLKITLLNEDCQGIERVLKLVKKFHEGCKDKDCRNVRNSHINFRLEWTSATFGDLQQLFQISKENSVVGDMESGSALLSKDQWEKIERKIRYYGNSPKLKERYTTDDISRLPKNIEQITFWILDSVHVEALDCLAKRLNGGTDKLQPIFINILGLMIAPSCDPFYLPQSLPVGKSYLNVSLRDADGERDFEWILQITDRLPRFDLFEEVGTCILRTWLNETRLPLSKWKELLERLRDNHVKTQILADFSGFSQSEFEALTIQNEPFDIYFLQWP